MAKSKWRVKYSSNMGDIARIMAGQYLRPTFRQYSADITHNGRILGGTFLPQTPGESARHPHFTILGVRATHHGSWVHDNASVWLELVNDDKTQISRRLYSTLADAVRETKSAPGGTKGWVALERAVKGMLRVNSKEYRVNCKPKRAVL
ncbi:hypothetical protein C8F04DRAFT_1198920 [Mycena alexandri]|uniref:Uncharacterized protein n=1 Tax=Mycena alexandri TaxID=1745969 RepID=A0AAD6WMZ9_9AGAR|nr:hypothetical protein C8F04DRAFT_1198920 [Mycena alexandri]